MSDEAGSKLKDRLAVAEFTLKTIVILIVVFAAWWLRNPLLQRFDAAGVSEIEAFGVRVSFVAGQLADTIDEAMGAEEARWENASAALPSMQRRLEVMGRLIPGSRLIWIDEGHPTANLYERRILQALGIAVDMVDSPEAARSLLTRSCYDIVVSEIRRGDNPTAGIDFAASLRDLEQPPGVVFYILNLDRSRGTPAYAHGITSNPVELVHLVLDIVERRTGGSCDSAGRPSP